MTPRPVPIRPLPRSMRACKTSWYVCVCVCVVCLYGISVSISCHAFWVLTLFIISMHCFVSFCFCFYISFFFFFLLTMLQTSYMEKSAVEDKKRLAALKQQRESLLWEKYNVDSLTFDVMMARYPACYILFSFLF